FARFCSVARSSNLAASAAKPTDRSGAVLSVRLRSPRHAGSVPGMWNGFHSTCFSMKRRLFNLLTAMSLLLLAAAVGMWIRSYFSGDALVSRVRGPRPPSGYALWAQIRSESSLLFIITVEDSPANPPQNSWSALEFDGSDGAWPRWRPCDGGFGAYVG